MNNKENTIPLVMIHKLERLFSENNWSLDTPGEQDVFKRFCEMFRMLTKEQQECILEVTKGFLRIELPQYGIHIRNCFSQIPLVDLVDVENIFILPIKTTMDYSKGNRSSSSLLYFLTDPTLISGTVLHNRRHSFIEHPDLLPTNFNQRNDLLFLIDDFIGSGETINKCLDIFYNKGISLSKIRVFALVMQKQAYDRLQSREVSSYASILRTRGISDSYDEPRKGYLLDIMSTIEELINVDPKMKFGFLQTEALVKMIRTPNDTFPAYWLNSKLRDGTCFCAPFPR